MQTELRSDARGDYLAVACDETEFLIDVADVHLLGDRKWFLFGHTSPSCRYVGASGSGRVIVLHREIMQCPKGLEVDHRDNQPLNCRRYNLRICTHAQNMSNAFYHKMGAVPY